MVKSNGVYVPSDSWTNRTLALVNIRFDSDALNLLVYTRPRISVRADVVEFIDDMSRAFAAYLQAQGFVKGDRVAVMMPNVPQYPVALAGILRAGCVLVNVNPLYTPRELEHQLKDSGAKGIVILENFAAL